MVSFTSNPSLCKSTISNTSARVLLSNSRNACCRELRSMESPASIIRPVSSNPLSEMGNPAISKAFMAFISVAVFANNGLNTICFPLFFTSKLIRCPRARFMFCSSLAEKSRSSNSLICTSLPFLLTISPCKVCPGTISRSILARRKLTLKSDEVLFVSVIGCCSPKNRFVSFIVPSFYTKCPINDLR